MNSEPILCKHCNKTIGYRRSVTTIGEPLGMPLDECVECHGKPIKPTTFEEKAKKHKEAHDDHWSKGEEMKKND